MKSLLSRVELLRLPGKERRRGTTPKKCRRPAAARVPHPGKKACAQRGIRYMPMYNKSSMKLM